MKSVRVGLGDRSYDIRIDSGIRSDHQEFLPWISGSQAFILSNESVAPLYLAGVHSALDGKDVVEMILPDGEHVKTLETIKIIFDRMLGIPLDRQATVIALGGGVVGDIAGFAAACYQRGIAFIQVPTTLLSQVDSSVGGKTGVNHPLGKNMIGAFHQPRRVIVDVETLRTLDARQFSAGMAEVIKYGVINDPEFFVWLERNIEAVMELDQAAIEYTIEQSCRNKARIVEQDEREGGVRALLNLGHTFGHAIETATDYRSWLHGEAVALGTLMAAAMSHDQGWVTSLELKRIRTLLERAGLPTQPSTAFSAGVLKENMLRDKKVQQGRIRLILCRGIGQAVVSDDYDMSALERVLREFSIG